MAATPQMVFLISLPRSGSTLLQKILASHPQIASVGEPWILLPLAFLDRDDGVEAIYAHRSAARGIREMIGNLHDGRRAYTSHLRRFCLDLFGDLARGKDIFLDKDTRYYLILDFLVELFPDAKFIFLFRNPLDVICSMMSTWLNNRLMLHGYHVDLYQGVPLMSHGFQEHAARSIGVQYEELVEQPEREAQRVCQFLGIRASSDMVVNYNSVDFGGSMGDPSGGRKYSQVSRASVGVWRSQLNNVYRVRFARRYIQALGDEVLAPWGFSNREFELAVATMDIHLRGSLRDLSYRHMSDLWRIFSGRRLRYQLRRDGIRDACLFA